MCRLIAGRLSLCLLWLPIAAGAQSNGPPRDAAESTSALEPIVVTGSYIRRTDTESPSPVSILSSDEITKQGFNSLADAIRSVTADNSGTLSQAFSGAMAGGASGVSLRGFGRCHPGAAGRAPAGTLSLG